MKNGGLRMGGWDGMDHLMIDWLDGWIVDVE